MEKLAKLAPESELGDRVGVLISTACAIHCALVPLLLVVLPAAGVAFGDERLEWGMVALAGSIAGWSLGVGYRRHRAKRVFVYLFVGLALLVTARLLEHSADRVVLAAMVSIAGAAALVAGHLTNLRLNRMLAAAERLAHS